MTLTDEVKKFTDSKPFYAVAGVGDYAIEKLRELPERLQQLQARRGEVGAAAQELPAKARGYAGQAASRAEAYAKELPVRARGYADQVTTKAIKLYDEFADRGRKIVSKTSGQAALELEEVSETAEPATAVEATTRKPRTTRTQPKA